MNSFKTIFLVLIASMFSPSGAYAQSSWWDKASSLFSKQEVISTSAELSKGEIGDAFKQALKIGSETVVSSLGSEDGFNADPAVHIPLPEQLIRVKTVLQRVGLSGMVDDLELKLNRAAEVATPRAKDLFLQSITAMTFTDVMTIYKGPEDAATQYFRDRMSPPLSAEMRPIVDNSLSEVGALQSYDRLMDKYTALPFVPDVKADLSTYVIDKAMDGIFYYMAREEAAIRADPARQTTALLKRVFGAK